MAEAQHISHRYDSELKTVQNRVLAMGELIVHRLGLKGMEREVHAAESATAQSVKDDG